MDVESLKKLKVAELKDRLQELELPTTGKKEELIQRLLDFHSTTSAPGTGEDGDGLVEDEDLLAIPTPTLSVSTTAAKEEPAIKKHENNNAAVKSPVKAVQQGMSEEEKRRQRAQRFGIPYVEPSSTSSVAVKDQPSKPPKNNNNKAKQEVKKDTKPTLVAVAPVPAALVIDPEVLKKRQERFGTVADTQKPSEPSQKKQKLSPM